MYKKKSNYERFSSEGRRDEQICLRMESSLMEFIDEYAKKQNVTKSEVFRQAVRLFISENNKENKK